MFATGDTRWLSWWSGSTKWDLFRRRRCEEEEDRYFFGNAKVKSIDLRFDLKRSEIDSSSIFHKSDKKRFHCLYLAAEEEADPVFCCGYLGLLSRFSATN